MEIERIGACDFYILYSCQGEFANEELKAMRELDKELEKMYKMNKEEYMQRKEEFSEKMNQLKSYIERIDKIIFEGWATKDELIKPENLAAGDYGPYYSLFPPFHSARQFVEKILNVTL